MKNYYLLLLLFPVLLSAQTKMNLQKFSSLDISTNVSITLIQSNENRLEYTILKGEAENLIIKESGDELNISTKSTGFFSSNDTKVNIKLYTQSLNYIEASSGSFLETSGRFKVNNLKINGSSGATVKMELEVDELKLEGSSGASITLEGNGKKTKIEASSGSTIKANNFSSVDVKAEASSGGSIKVWCKEKLSAEASSGGSIIYKGEPTSTNIDAGYSGSIKKGG